MESERGNVGLGGDGDEIAALRDVEEEFAVKLDYSFADEWTNVGNVWDALLRELPEGASEQPETWTRFKDALCRETGMDPARINLDSGLVAEDGHWVQVADASAVLWLLAFGAIIFVAWWVS